MKTEILSILAAMINCNNESLMEKAEKELEELMRLAKIGLATKKAFSKSVDGLFIRTNKNFLPNINFSNKDGLLDWSESDGE